jgi:nucleoid-associated protein YgaU
VPRPSCRGTVLIRIISGLLLSVTLQTGGGHAAPSAESAQFLAGFGAYDEQEFTVAVEKLSRFLREYPASPLRDVTLYWLARALYGNGDRFQAAGTMARFLKEYPTHPLKGSAEKELLALGAEYGRSRAVTALTPGEAAGATEAPPVAKAAATPPPDGLSVMTVTVQPGDTLVKLAKRSTGKESSLRQILRLNRIDNPDLIFSGTTLRVPTPSPLLRNRPPQEPRP